MPECQCGDALGGIEVVHLVEIGDAAQNTQSSAVGLMCGQLGSELGGVGCGGPFDDGDEGARWKVLPLFGQA